MSHSSDTLAREILDTVPLIMRAIRTEMRSRRAAGLTVPQFRALLFLDHNPGASLQEVAGHLGLTSPTVCRMVDGLVTDRLVTRRDSSSDRRKVLLTLTAEGQVILERAQAGTRARLADILSVIDGAERDSILRAMERLHGLFSPAPETIPGR